MDTLVLVIMGIAGAALHGVGAFLVSRRLPHRSIRSSTRCWIPVALMLCSVANAVFLVLYVGGKDDPWPGMVAGVLTTGAWAVAGLIPYAALLVVRGHVDQRAGTKLALWSLVPFLGADVIAVLLCVLPNWDGSSDGGVLEIVLTLLVLGPISALFGAGCGFLIGARTITKRAEEHSIDRA
jgi:hypothetical protein